MRKSILLTLCLLLAFPVVAQKRMASITFRLNFDLDSTVRNLGTGTTSVPTTAIEGDKIVISLDADGTEALIEMAEDGVKPSAIDNDSANWKLSPGQQLVFEKPTGGSEQARWDLRQFFAVGTGKIRIVVTGTANNTTPS